MFTCVSLLCVFCSYHDILFVFFFFFKQKTAYEMRISDWSSDVCSSDLLQLAVSAVADAHRLGALIAREPGKLDLGAAPLAGEPIHDLQLRRTSGGSAQHPLAPCSRLVPVTRCQQGIARARGIADHAIAVDPVAPPGQPPGHPRKP